MPPRSTWKGFLRLSLVSVPVKAYTATASGGEIHLNQLHKDCHSPIKYRKVCPTHGELDAESIVSGFQYAKEHYVVIDPEEIAKLRRESDKAVNIDGFFPAEELDPVYFSGRNHYLAPDGPVGQKAFALLRQVMAAKGLYAVAQVVLSGKEQLVLLRPSGKLLVMSGLSYANQVTPASSFEDEVVDPQFSKDEVALTEKLVEATTLDELDLSKYKNVYVETLTELIEAKVAGKEIVAAPPAEEPKVIELMEALKQSVARVRDRAAERAPAKGKKAASKMAPSTAGKRAAAGGKKRKGAG
jgi:DNA end-binding protein Ku